MNENKSELSEYDVRQIRIMKDLVVRLLERRIELNKFLNDQWALIDMLETVAESWSELYLEKVNSIEIILATGLDDGSTRLTVADENEIDIVAKQLLKSLNEIIPESEN